MRSRLSVLFAFVLGSGLAGTLAIPAALANPSVDEMAFVSLINQARIQAGVAPVTVLPVLVSLARGHSAEMAGSGSIWHMPNLGSQFPPGWQLVGENVGVGTINVAGLHQAFMNSPSHGDNILNGAYNFIGVGVAYGGDGRLYVSEEFMQSAGVAALSTGFPIPASQVPAVPAPRALPRNDWYFAEGYTGPGFTEELNILNPLAAPAPVSITYLLPGGATRTQQVTVAPTTRAVVNVNDAVGPGQEVSAVVKSPSPVVADRKLRFFHRLVLDGQTEQMGSVAPATSFYFAEGYTGPTFEEYLTVANPQDRTVNASVSFHFSDGTTSAQARSLPAHSRTTIDVNQAVGPDREVAVTMNADGPIVAERPMYFAYDGLYTGGHISAGMTAPATQLNFAEGFTGPSFLEYITLLNPGTAPATVSLTYLLDGGGSAAQTVRVAPRARSTVRVNDAVPNREVSVSLSSDKPVVAERAMYFAYKGEITGGHNVVGATAPARYWMFPGGDTTAGTDSYLTVGNPQTRAVPFTVVFFDDQGRTLTRNFSIEPRARKTLDLAREAGSGRRLGAQLQAVDPVMAEQPSYTRVGVNGGSCVTGYPILQ